MKTFVSALVAGSALLAAVPAAALAQPMPPPPPAYGHDAPRGWELDRRIDWLQQRIDRGRQDGSLDWREARRVQGELIHIRRDEHALRARSGGRLTDRDRFMLQERLDRLGDQIRWLRHADVRRPW